MSTMTTQNVIDAITEIALKVTKFKIGKTGQTIAGRWDSDYKDSYANIKAICQSSIKTIIDNTEETMIKYFMSQPEFKNKLQNQQIGGGEMKDATVYVLYIVY